MNQRLYNSHPKNTVDPPQFNILSPQYIQNQWLVHLSILFFYGVLTVFMTCPGIKHLDTHFLGENIDLWINLWPTWWTRKVITESLKFYSTDLMFYPGGTNLVFHSFSHINTAFELLASLFVSPLAAYNLAILASLPLSGYAMFCLVYDLTNSRRAGLFAGLVFAFFTLPHGRNRLSCAGEYAVDAPLSALCFSFDQQTELAQYRFRSFILSPNRVDQLALDDFHQLYIWMFIHLLSLR